MKKKYLLTGSVLVTRRVQLLLYLPKSLCQQWIFIILAAFGGYYSRIGDGG